MGPFTLAIHNQTDGGYRFFQCGREISEFPVMFPIPLPFFSTFVTTPHSFYVHPFASIFCRIYCASFLSVIMKYG